MAEEKATYCGAQTKQGHPCRKGGLEKYGGRCPMHKKDKVLDYVLDEEDTNTAEEKEVEKNFEHECLGEGQCSLVVPYVHCDMCTHCPECRCDHCLCNCSFCYEDSHYMQDQNFHCYACRCKFCICYIHWATAGQKELTEPIPQGLGVNCQELHCPCKEVASNLKFELGADFFATHDLESYKVICAEESKRHNEETFDKVQNPAVDIEMNPGCSTNRYGRIVHVRLPNAEKEYYDLSKVCHRANQRWFGVINKQYERYRTYGYFNV